MDEIAAGKGRAPKPFMTGEAQVAPSADAVGIRTGVMPTSDAPRRARTQRSRQAARRAMPDFVAPAALHPGRTSAGGEGWGHEIKFDGYRVQLRVEGGEAALRTRKGLDWTEKFQAIAKEAGALPDVLIDGEIVALDHNGAPDFSTLQAALSDGKTDNLVFFAFDLLFADGEDLRRLPLGERKARLEAIAGERGKARANHPLCRAFRGPAAMPFCNRRASCRWKASSPRNSARPIARAAPRAGPRPNAAPATRS